MYRSNSGERPVPIVLIGLGKVGMAFWKHVQAAAPDWRRRGVRIEIAAYVRREGYRFGETGSYVPMGDARAFADRCSALGAPPVLVDASGSDLSRLHLLWLERGWPVVTANKIPLSGPPELAERLLAAARDPRGCRYWFEATVGAGLPVISTLRELVATGDEDVAVEATLSGTLNYLCASRDAHIGFEDALENAKNLGLTEPDPRTDLRGTDVLRKAVILARLLGDVVVAPEHEPFMPAEALDADDWRERAAKAFERRYKGAKRLKATLRYVARVTKRRCVVRLEEVTEASRFIQDVDTRSRFVITSGRYPTGGPMEIVGPGAGPDVTATALLGDVLAANGLL